MRYRRAPENLVKLYEKPGREWTPDERAAYKRWLQVPEQLARDSSIVAAELFRRTPRGLASIDDVREVVQEFHTTRVDRVIDRWDPSKGQQEVPAEPRFWFYYDGALRLSAKERAKDLRDLAVRLRPLMHPDRDGGSSGVEPVDPGESPEERAIRLESYRQLRACLKELTPCEWVVVRGSLDSVPLKDIAAQIGETEEAVRQRFKRAKRRLLACLTRLLGAPTPSTQTASRPRRPPDLDVDVLILGGGVMGLWLLNALRRRGYSAILFERDRLGGGQTCHSHLYIHRGLVYSDRLELALALKCAEEMWRVWLAAHPQVERGDGRSMFGFRNQAQARLRRAFWEQKELGFRCDPVVPLPNVLQGGEIRYAYESPELCLRGPSLIAALAEPVNDVISRVNGITFSLAPTPERIERIDAEIPERGTIGVRPRAVVFAAGSGNQALLDDVAALSSALPAGVGTAQQIRRAHMLVIKGSRQALPPLTGVFALTRSLFIVSRQSGDDRIWLVSDERSPVIRNKRDEARYTLDGWLPGVISSLRELSSTLFDDLRVSNLTWWAYEAPKAEVHTADGVLPHDIGIEQCGVRNLWAVWPTKLTFAPLACTRVFDQLGAFLGPASRWPSPPTAWSTMRHPASIAPERWQDATPAMWKRTW